MLAHEPGAWFSGPVSSLAGLIAVHCVAGLAGANAILQKLLHRHSQGMEHLARIDGAGFWRIFWQL
jgi:glucose/mannose transport system permease protein